MPAPFDALRRLPTQLSGEYHQGRRQRLFPRLTTAVRLALEDCEAVSPATRLGAFLVIQAILAKLTATGHLVRPLHRDLLRHLRTPPALTDFLDPDVLLVFCATQQFNQGIRLPNDLVDVAQTTVDAVAQAAAGWSAIGPEIWDAVGLSSLRPEAAPARGGLVFVNPPLTAQTSDQNRPRPLGASLPEEIAVGLPPTARVIDGLAERLWFDELLAALLAAEPEQVAIGITSDGSDVALELLRHCQQLLPGARRTLVLGADAGVSDSALAHYVIAGPPYGALRLLLADEPPSRRVLAPHPPQRRPDFRAWPLACGRRRPIDADLALPVTGYDGALLASWLLTAHQQAPMARLRLREGLTAAQAVELAAAMPQPDPPAWSLRLSGPVLPGDPATLVRAGLRQVVLAVGPGATDPSGLEVVSAAFRDLGLALLLEVDATDVDPDELLAALLAAEPQAVCVGNGEQAEAIQERWDAHLDRGEP